VSAAFHFRLARLLSVRRAGEEEARARWTGAQGEVAARQADVDARSAERTDAEVELRIRARGSIDPAGLRAAMTYRESAGRRYARSEDGAKAAAKEAEEKRRALVDAARRVRILERLEEGSRANWTARGRAAEARDLDDRARRGENP
jgi:flagellar export protein FliJ